MATSFPLPRSAYRVATFKEYLVYQGDDHFKDPDNFIRERSSLTIDEQVQQWLAKTKAMICVASSPSPSVAKDADGFHYHMAGITVLYYDAVDQIFDSRGEANNARQEDPREKKYFATGSPYNNLTAQAGAGK